MGMFSGHSVAIWPRALRLRVGAANRTARTVLRRCARPLAHAPGFVALLLSAASIGPSDARANQFVQMDYNITLASRSRGTVFIELFDDRPLTRDNFLAYVNGGKYNGSLMHRQAFNGVTPFVLQGGGFYLQYQTEPAPLNISLNPNARVDLDGNAGTPNPTVNNEFGNSPTRSNVKGTLAMAKLGGDPNSATSEYFFNLNNNAANLDTQNGGFTVFAQVVGDGMSLIDAYNGLSRLALDQDADDNGVRDAGPFNEVPALTGATTFLPLLLDRVKVVDYLGSGLLTTIPAGGLTFSAHDAFIDTGTIFTGTGALTIGTGRTLGMREGFSLGRDLVNHGTLAPGLQLGAITVPNYFQFSDGTLDINLAGTTPDTHYDRIVTTNEAFVAGKLRVSFLSSFTPLVGNSFTVLTASSITGTFTTFELPQLTAGLVWNISKTTSNYTLTIATGDYNRNGVVDMADYVLWRDTRLANITPYSGSDGNGYGVVSDADLTIWRSNFGNVRGTASGAGSGSLAASGVPEPAITVLLVCGVLPFVGYRGRRAAFGRGKSA